jgi:predicted oxidoreductase
MLAFSEVVAGTMSWGNWGQNFSKTQMKEMMSFCVNHGINTFDHADIYGHYTTEKTFGDAFRESGIQRSEIILISKCGIKLISPNRDHTLKHYDYRKQHIIQSCETSLSNLSTDYLDLFLLHRPSPLIQLDEVSEAISILFSQGKIRSFGLSNFTNLQTELIRSEIPVLFNQISFSLSDHQAMLDGSLDYMQIHKIRPMAWAPLGNYYQREPSNPKNALVKQIAVKYETTEDVILYHWIMKHPAQIIPVFGTTNKVRILNLVNKLDLQFSQEDWFALWENEMGHEVA